MRHILFLNECVLLYGLVNGCDAALKANNFFRFIFLRNDHDKCSHHPHNYHAGIFKPKRIREKYTAFGTTAVD